MNTNYLEVCSCYKCEPFDSKLAKLSEYGKNIFRVFFFKKFLFRILLSFCNCIFKMRHVLYKYIHKILYVTCSTKITNKSEMLSLAIPLRSVHNGEFGCDGKFSGVDVFN